VNLPNSITALRIILAPIATVLLLQPHSSSRLLAMGVFLIAALSDLADGALARQRGEVTDFGKLVDPIADKLLLVATLVPFYLLTSDHPELGNIPLFGGIGLWILVVIFGREMAVTWMRTGAARRGVVMPAQPSGKYKAFSQNVFIGSMILWLAFRTETISSGWSGPLNTVWEVIHGWFTMVSLIVALGLTVYSFVIYLAVFRSLPHEPAS